MFSVNVQIKDHTVLFTFNPRILVFMFILVFHSVILMVTHVVQVNDKWIVMLTVIEAC